MAAPGDYYLFDSTGCILVRPSSSSFSYHPFFNSQELWADRHVDETGNPVLPHSSGIPVFWFGVTEALAQNWRTDGLLPSGHAWLSAFGAELPPEIYVKTSELSVIPAGAVDVSRFVLPDGFTEASWASSAPKLDLVLRGSGFHGTDLRAATSSADVGEHWRQPPTGLGVRRRAMRENSRPAPTQAPRVDTIPVVSEGSNAHLRPSIPIPRMLLDQRTTIDENGRLRFPSVPTEAEVSARLDRTREQTGNRSAAGNVRDTTALITVEFQQTDIRDVVRTFSKLSGRTIVLGTGVAGFVTASIRNRSWKAALVSILEPLGFSAVEDSTGVISIVKLSDFLESIGARSLFRGVGLDSLARDSVVDACPIFIVDGVEQPSTCPTKKKPDGPKCDARGPIFIIDGVIQYSPCSKPSPQDPTWFSSWSFTRRTPH